MKSTSTKIYYVLKYLDFGGYAQDGLGGFGLTTARTAQEALRFDSIVALLNRLEKRALKHGSVPTNFAVVRVEETNGSETRTVLGEGECSKPGTIVKYALSVIGNGFGTIPGKHWGARGDWGGSVDAATLYDTQSAALAALINARRDHSTADFNVVRVAVSQGTPTAVETVLA